jgi:hypothetical protein
MLSSTLLHRSDALHARVQQYVLGHGEPFDVLACDLARFQADACNGLERLLAARRLQPRDLERAADIPAIPTDAFKLRRIACHPPEADAAVFRTSGTTIGARGEHAMRTTSTYELAALTWARELLFVDAQPVHLVLLASEPGQAGESSLGFMLALFARQFASAHTWLLQGERLHVEALARVAADAHQAGCPVLVAGAAFAFVHLIEQLGGKRLELPAGSRVMQTGGYKGKSREVSADELRRAIVSALSVPDAMIASEYGMTELSSQAYDGTVRASLGLDDRCGPPGLYFSPPWMRVQAVDPVSLAEVAPGEIGIARITDLANVDSAVAIQTADQVRCLRGGFELLGRLPGATPRGCSIGIDELLGAR